MNEMTQSKRDLKTIEWEIQYHMEHAANELIEVGRCLIEVQSGDMVPAGKWTEWVGEHTGMSIRSAQRLMQAAREVPAGSWMASLSMGKITALLQLPAGERESFGKEHDAENATVRELEKQVKEYKEKLDAADDVLKARESSWCESMRRMNSENAKERKKAVADAVKAAEDGMESRIAAETAKRSEHLRMMFRNMQDAKMQADEKIGRMQERLNELEQMQDDSAGQEAEIERLHRDIDRLTRQSEEARSEALRLRKQLAQGGGNASDGELTVSELKTAVDAFLARAGVMPHMAMVFAGIDNMTREQYRRQVEIVSSWADAAKNALNTVMVEEAAAWTK